MTDAAEPARTLRETAVSAMTGHWKTKELLAETQDVWAEVYGRPVPKKEAIKILWNSRRYAEVLIDAARQMKKNKSAEQPGP